MCGLISVGLAFKVIAFLAFHIKVLRFLGGVHLREKDKDSVISSNLTSGTRLTDKAGQKTYRMENDDNFAQKDPILTAKKHFAGLTR